MKELVHQLTSCYGSSLCIRDGHHPRLGLHSLMLQVEVQTYCFLLKVTRFSEMNFLRGISVFFDFVILFLEKSS